MEAIGSEVIFTLHTLTISTADIESVFLKEQELVDACVEHIRAHKSAESLVEELEPVLADEATEFVVKVMPSSCK